MNPGVEQLAKLFEKAPAPVPRYKLEPHEGSAGPLEADAELAHTEDKWRAAFPQIKPTLVMTQHGESAVWNGAARWLPRLESAPLLWESFDVLDDLAMALDALPTLGTGEDLLEPILERGVALLRINLERNAAQELRFEWGWMENRPALRMAAHLALRRAERGDWERFVPLAEWMMALNPGDNHGLREPLSRAYLETGSPERVLELTAKYPDDAMAATVMNRILALWRCGRRGDALTELAEAARGYSEAVRMLLADDPRPPKMGEYGITRGGKDEAWLYRQACRALWERDGALAWLKEAWRATAARKRSE